MLNRYMKMGKTDSDCAIDHWGYFKGSIILLS